MKKYSFLLLLSFILTGISREIPKVGDKWIEDLPYYPAIVTIHKMDECSVCGRELSTLYRTFFPQCFFQAYLNTDDPEKIAYFSFTRKLLFDVKYADLEISDETPVLFIIDTSKVVIFSGKFPGSEKAENWVSLIKNKLSP